MNMCRGLAAVRGPFLRLPFVLEKEIAKSDNKIHFLLSFSWNFLMASVNILYVRCLVLMSKKKKSNLTTIALTKIKN